MAVQAQLDQKQAANADVFGEREATPDMTSLPLGNHGSRPAPHAVREKVFGDTVYLDVNYGIRKHQMW